MTTSNLLLAAALLGACSAQGEATEPELSGVDTQLSAAAAAGFQPFGALGGRETYVTGMSATGDVVVGFAAGAGADVALRWTEGAGLKTLPGAGGRALAVSPDGTFVVGSVNAPGRGEAREARLWPASGAFQRIEGLSVPGGPQLFSVTEGQVVLDDGRVFGTCLQHNAYGEPLACRYDGPNELEIFGLGQVYAADAAGNFVGTRQSERHAPFMTVATFNGEALPYPDGADCTPISGCQAAAYDLTEAGELIVGTALSPTPSAQSSSLEQVAFVHTQEGAQRLPVAADGEASGAYAVTPDGRVIAGFGSEDGERVALVWVEREPLPLAELIEAGALPDGFVLRDVRAVSDDARVYAGNATNARGEAEGYRLVLPDAP